MEELQANKNRLVTIVYCMPTLASVAFVIFVAVFLGTACCSYKKSIQKSKADNSMLISNKWRSAIAAIAVISAVNIFYALGASCYAWSAIKHQPELTFRSTLLSYVSVMVALADGILLLLCITTDLFAFFAAVCYSIDCAYIILGCTSLYSLLCILQHCPYIILAYINDAELTGSIFIFYTLSWSLIFLALNRFYAIYQELVLPCCVNDSRTIAQIDLEASCSSSTSEVANFGPDLEASLTSNASEELSIVNQHRTRARARDQYEDLDEKGSRKNNQSSRELFCKSFLFVLCSLGICTLIIGAVVLLTCYLIILPITNGLSHLFGRLIDTYHTAIVIVGAFLAYKTFIEKKNDSQTELQREQVLNNNPNQGGVRPTNTQYGTNGSGQGGNESETPV